MTKWISVLDRLPGGSDVIVWAWAPDWAEDGPVLATYDGLWWQVESNEFIAVYVTHWTHIITPDPPEEAAHV